MIRHQATEIYSIPLQTIARSSFPRRRESRRRSAKTSVGGPVYAYSGVNSANRGITSCASSRMDFSHPAWSSM